MDAQTEIRKLMTEELLRLKSRNGSYSLRAFARKLHLVPSAVSEIMNGRRPISAKFATKILENLGTSPDRTQKLITSLQLSKTSSDEADTYSQEYVQLDMDAYHAIADWQYFAILSLAETKDFREDPGWIAKRLNIKTTVAEKAVQRLERMGLLKRLKNGKLIHAPEKFRTTTDITSMALRQSHRQNLELAQASLDKDPVELRDFSSMTMAIDPKLLPKAKEKIMNFRRSLSEFLESDEKKEVYRICIQLIPLSQEEK